MRVMIKQCNKRKIREKGERHFVIVKECKQHRIMGFGAVKDS